MKTTRLLPVATLIIVLVTAPVLSAQQQPAQGTPLSLEMVATGFSRPVFACAPPLDYSRLFVVEQRGSSGVSNRAEIRILNLKTRTVKSKPFLIVNSVGIGTEEGLLGLAFHPNYANNRYFYTYHTNSSGNNVVTRYTTSAINPDSADPTSATVLLTINHPTNNNHNGGWIGFGADGYLYIATGDGGSSGDPANSAQNLSTLLGKILRIDVNTGVPYSIPPTNPFFGGPEKQEIFHYGLRNPWRCSFDRQTGEFYIGDVGESTWEEINWRPAGDSGNINFGWRLKEGTDCFNPPVNCDPSGITTDPIYRYDHGQGCAVVGGFVYRGCLIPDLVGTYFFGDYCSGSVWSFRYNGVDTSNFEDRTAELGLGIFGITSFGQDGYGEIYLMFQSGQLYRIISGTGFTDCNGNHMSDSCDIAHGFSRDRNSNGVPDECEFLCGDADASGLVDISDAVLLIAYIFSGGPAPSPIESGDADCSGLVDISDAVYLIAYIFAGGPAPCSSC